MPWLTTSWHNILMVLISSVGIYVAVIIFTRIAGLRSFSKMSSFDFAVTVAFGSIIANVVTSKNPSLLLAIVAMGTLYFLQIAVASFRGKSSFLDNIVDNDPLLLMKDEEILYDNLKKAKVTEDDLRAKLREANVTKYSQIHAVIMEATGDISVMHNDDEGHDIDGELLKDVRGWDQ